MTQETIEILSQNYPPSHLNKHQSENTYQPNHKLALARKNLEKLHSKFSRIADISNRELDKIDTNLESDFIQRHSAQHLAKLAFFIHSIRKKLSRDITICPLDDHHVYRHRLLQHDFALK